MAQSKKMSMVETCCNVTSGVVTAFLSWRYIVIPMGHSLMWDYNNLLLWQIIMTNGIFTLISVVRGYAWRRVFNHVEK